MNIFEEMKLSFDCTEAGLLIDGLLFDAKLVYYDIEYEIKNSELGKKITEMVRTIGKSITMTAIDKATYVIETAIISAFHTMDNFIEKSGKIGMTIHTAATALGLQALRDSGINWVCNSISDLVKGIVVKFIDKNRTKEETAIVNSHVYQW